MVNSAAMAFFTERGVEIPALTAQQMRMVDQIAVDEFDLGLLQMMENAGRSLAELILSRLSEDHSKVISLDVPSGMDATNGESPGDTIEAQTTLTLALPKTGLEHFRGELYLADIGIPAEVYSRIGIIAADLFEDKYLLPVTIR